MINLPMTKRLVEAGCRVTIVNGTKNINAEINLGGGMVVFGTGSCIATAVLDLECQVRNVSLDHLMQDVKKQTG